MPGDRLSIHAAPVIHIASTIPLGIAIQQLLIISLGRYPQPKIFAWNGCKIQRTDDKVVGILRPPDVGECRLVAVVEIDPFKTGPVKIHFMEGRLTGIQVIQISHKLLKPAMRFIIQEVPL